jgi:hypothetical protein
MIRRLTLDELIDAAKNLGDAEQIELIAALGKQVATSGGDVASLSTSERHGNADNWSAFASESLSRAYGESEPEYSEKDLVQ